MCDLTINFFSYFRKLEEKTWENIEVNEYWSKMKKLGAT